MEGEHTPMEDAEAQLYRRIQELRARARGLEEEQSQPPAGTAQTAEQRPAMPDLRTILARAESHVDELRATASALEQRLPAQVEQAIQRAMATHGGQHMGSELQAALAALSRQVDQVNRDVLAERLGRVEDLELMVDLISTGMAEMRKDAATLNALLERFGGRIETVLEKLDQPLQVTVERPQRAGVRDLFTPTDADPTPADSPDSQGAHP